jgi:hypothetical protein
MPFDLAIIETGNGGDLQLAGSDLGVVFAGENMPYLAMFGGNVEQSTPSKVTQAQSFDWWGNNLFMISTPSAQFNSEVERALRNTPLTSSGRIIIENAIKSDLKFLSQMGAKVTVSVEIVSDDRIDVTLRVVQDQQTEQVRVINFKKKSDGDWYLFDFNNDFLV